MVSSGNSLQLRLVIPPALKRDGKPVFENALAFFESRNAGLFLQEKLRKLSKSLPVVCEGVVSEAVLHQFLVSFPDIDKIVILTSPLAQAARAAA